MRICKIWSGLIVVIIVVIVVVSGGKQSQILLCMLRTKERVHHQSKLLLKFSMTSWVNFIYFESNAHFGVKKYYSGPWILVIRDQDLLTPGPRLGNPRPQSDNLCPELKVEKNEPLYKCLGTICCIL